MKLLIDIDKDYYEILKNLFEHGDDYKPHIFIARGIPYEEKLDGEWIECYPLSLKCSICKEEALDFNDYPYESNFCPNCGAKMKVKNLRS